MEELNELKKKVENKKNNDSNVNNIDYTAAIDSFRLDIKQVYNKMHNIEDNLMKKMRYIDKKQDEILELLQKNNNNVDVEELQKQKEIMELEEKLKELRGE